MKIDFSILKKFDILLLDDNISNLSFKNFSSYQADTKKINFFILVKTLFSFVLNKKKLSLKQLYKKNLYDHISPKIAISHHINQKGQECKKLCPYIKLLVYQFSYFHEHKYQNFKIDKSLNCDYFLTWSIKDKKFFSKKNFNKIKVCGSIRNNNINIIKKKEKFKLMLISEYDPRDINKNSYLVNNLKKFLSIIDSFCLKKNITLMIALRSKRKDKKFDIVSEKNYSHQIMNCKKVFDDENKNSYETAYESNVAVCFHSNLGFELLSRKKKVMFLPFHENKLKKNHYLDKRNNFHIHRKINKKEIFTKLENLITLKQKDWKRKISKKKYLIKYDPNNTILNQIIAKLISNRFF